MDDPGDAVVGPRLTAEEAAVLPAKLRWAVVGWFRASGDLQAAGGLLDRIEAREGVTIRLLEERARVAFAAGRTEEARTLLSERIERSPSATAWIALARLALETGDLAAAGDISRDLCRDEPDLATVAALAADVAQALGDFDAARAHHEGFLDDRPGHVGALLALGRIALLGGSTDEAAGRLDAALATEGASAAQLATAAELAAGLDRADEADRLRARARRLDAERAAALAAAVDDALGRETGPTSDAPSPAVASTPAATAPRATRAPSKNDAPAARRPDGPAAAPAAGSAAVAAAPGHAPIVAPAEVPVEPRLMELLQQEFGFGALRPGQGATIANVRAGRDTLAIMPTGAGKSLTFQLPAMLGDGTTLVLSPLIALMKDQVDGLPPAVRERTALLNSSLSPDEQRRVLDGIGAGAYKLVYVAPERLRQHAFLRALRTAGVSLVVVDEAHCISLWGHDFRPDYLAIPSALPELGDPPLLAITATATPQMVGAIGAGFGRELDLIRVSVFRPNLFYEAHRVANREEKIATVLEVARRERGAGIVYVTARRDAESLAGVLRDRGVVAIPYHAGLDPATRAGNQQRFMDGDARVVVATVAFGMGVDKADVRFIVHLSPPRSLEAYAQESGRAGRDGAPARCVLLVAPSDQASLTRFARRDELDLETVRRVYAAVKRSAVGRWALVDPAALLPTAGFDGDADDGGDPRIALGLLDQAGVIRRHLDAPVSYAVRLGGANADKGRDEGDDDPTWARLAAWAEIGPAGAGGGTIRTAEACEALGLSPVALGRLLGARRGLSVREGPRLVCLELLPVGNDVGARLGEIMDRSRRETQERIARVFAYADGGRCRHVMLANHLGEGLEPCGDACDVCRGTATPRSRSARSTGAEPAGARRSGTTAADALAVLTAVRTLPFTMGKTGLVKLLTGSVESRVRADRSAQFGVLVGLPKGKVDGLVDRLVEEGWLHRDLSHDYKIVTLTDRGAAAAIEDLAPYDPPAGTGGGDPSGNESIDEDLLARLERWRSERASRDAVPPYVVAHNSMLRDVAAAEPRTAEALARIKGFGASRVEKYGPEILELVAAG